jgi:hypothetical protein
MVLDGSRGDFAEMLGLDPQSFEKHCPELGRAGCWYYVQPQHGYYRFTGFTQTQEEVEALRNAWTQALAWAANMEKTQGKRISAQLLTAKVDELVKASKLTLPVVDVSLSSVLKNSFSSPEKQQQEQLVIASKMTPPAVMDKETPIASKLTRNSQNSDGPESKLTRSSENPPEEASELTQIELSDELEELLSQMGWAGNRDLLLQACEKSEKRVLGWARYCLDPRQRNSIRNPSSLFSWAIRDGDWPPKEYLSQPPAPDSVENTVLMTSPPEPESIPGYKRQPEARETWKQALSQMELQMTRATFDTWLNGSRGIGYQEDDQTLVVQVKNSYAVEFLTHRLGPVIERTTKSMFGVNIPVQFVTPGEIEVGLSERS